MAEKDTYSVRFKPASLRCSACAIAGVTLSFCSVEHQKLVWKTHKLVCGPPLATKFTHSPLTAQEIDFAKRNLDTPNPFAALAAAAGIRSGGVTTLWEGLKIGGLRRDQVEPMLEMLTKSWQHWQKPSNLVISPHQVIRTVRYYRAQNHSHMPFFEPFSLLADWEIGATNCAAMEGAHGAVNWDKPWYTLFSHRAVCYYAAVQSERSKLGKGSTFDTYLEEVNTKWQADVVKLVKKEDPGALEYVRWALQSSYGAMKGTFPG